MLTKRTIENLAGLHPRFRLVAEDFVAAVNEALAPKGVTAEVLSGLRSWQQQAALYAQGRTKPGKIVTKAAPGSSWHNYGVAIDLGLFKGGVYLDEKSPAQADKLYYGVIRAIAIERYGLECAMDWKSFTETPHFQKTYGNKLADLRVKMKDCDYDVRKLKL
jgi:peptidoglycan LD-endopeptidase CwlK